MSKSLARVTAALSASGADIDLREMAQETRTAEQAAAAAGCQLDQIVKSIIFRGEISGQILLFLTAGGHQVEPARASGLAGEPLGRADADLVRRHTGFAIGGVAPIGHLNPVALFMDPRVLEFELVWAAAGTPRHIFSIAPTRLQRITHAEVAIFTA